MDNLKIENAAVINSVWPHKRKNSEKYIEILIEANGGIGIFCVENDKLVAWSIKSEFGGLQTLQVAEDHQRKYLAKLVVLAHAKVLAEQGLDTFGCVKIDNKAANDLFDKMGCQRLGPVFWLFDDVFEKDK